MSARRIFRIGTVVASFAAVVTFAAADLGTTSPAMNMASMAPIAFNPNLSPGESITVAPAQWPPVIPSTFPQPAHVGFHEFKVECAVAQIAPIDPIVAPGTEPTAHSHTLIGATNTSPDSTTASLLSSTTTCAAKDDHSAYWFPTLLYGPACPKTGMVQAPFAGCAALTPRSSIVYYKSGIKAYGTVRAFPAGLRFVLGSPVATPAQFAATDGTEMWSCGSSFHNVNFPASCPPHADLIIRFDAPSCWDGVNLDTADHKSQMAYPVNGVCPASHPVALPMLEFRIAYPLTGTSTSLLRLSSGPSYTWHADFFAAWSMPTQEALVTQCINGGGQCDTRGYDPHHPERGYVLNATGHLAI